MPDSNYGLTWLPYKATTVLNLTELRPMMPIQGLINNSATSQERPKGASQDRKCEANNSALVAQLVRAPV